MAGGRWVSILDPKVLKRGMRVKTCLDMDHPNFEEDSEGEERISWFYAKIDTIGQQIHSDNEYPPGSLRIDVLREDHEDGPWHIVLHNDNLEYIKIWIVSDWDD